MKYSEAVALADAIKRLQKIEKLARRATKLWCCGCDMTFHETMAKLKAALDDEVGPWPEERSISLVAPEEVPLDLSTNPVNVP